MQIQIDACVCFQQPSVQQSVRSFRNDISPGGNANDCFHTTIDQVEPSGSVHQSSSIFLLEQLHTQNLCKVSWRLLLRQYFTLTLIYQYVQSRKETTHL